MDYMRKAINDIFYMIGLWLIIRLNPVDGGRLLIKWGQALKRRGREVPRITKKDIERMMIFQKK